jgi:hypothetical protein
MQTRYRDGDAPRQGRSQHPRAGSVWAMADPDAPGAACRTYQGQWTCSPTVNDYSLVMRVIIGGVTRNQRYTRLNESASNQRARALGDFVLAWARKREGTASSTTTARF